MTSIKQPVVQEKKKKKSLWRGVAAKQIST